MCPGSLFTGRRTNTSSWGAARPPTTRDRKQQLTWRGGRARDQEKTPVVTQKAVSIRNQNLRTQKSLKTITSLQELIIIRGAKVLESKKGMQITAELEA